MISFRSLVLITVGAGAITTGIALAGADVQGTTKAAQPAGEIIVPFYGNETCPMTGKKVNPTAFVEHEGQRVYYCCKSCKAKGSADPKSQLGKAYAEPKEMGNKICPISGKDIDVEKAKEVVFQGHALMLCCPGCEKAFAEAPALQLTKATYPKATVVNTVCPIMDNPVDGITHVVYEEQIVQFCCPGCIDEMKQAPEETLAAAKKLGDS